MPASLNLFSRPAAPDLRGVMRKETTPNRWPGCACGWPWVELVRTGHEALFRARCCFALYQYIAPHEPGGLPLLSLVAEGPEPLPPGLCDGCGALALDLWPVDAAPVAGAALCRACLEGPETGAI